MEKNMTEQRISKEQWIELFRDCGMTDDMMHAWHRAFEKKHPQAHQRFLSELGIPEQEIKTIRAHCK